MALTAAVLCFCPITYKTPGLTTYNGSIRGGVVPLTGLEPVRYFYRGILSPLRLPIPPQRLVVFAVLRFGVYIVRRDIVCPRFCLPILPVFSGNKGGKREGKNAVVKYLYGGKCPEKQKLRTRGKSPYRVFRKSLEAPPGFEPGSEGFADLCLTTWL